jgi:hypothetical protein
MISALGCQENYFVLKDVYVIIISSVITTIIHSNCFHAVPLEKYHERQARESQRELGSLGQGFPEMGSLALDLIITLFLKKTKPWAKARNDKEHILQLSCRFTTHTYICTP